MMSTIGILIILLIIGFVAWTLLGREDMSSMAIIIGAIGLIMFGLLEPEYVGNVLIAAGIVSFVGFFVGGGVALGLQFSRSPKKMED